MRRTLFSKNRPQIFLFLFVFVATLIVPLISIAPASAASVIACEDRYSTQSEYDNCMNDGSAFGKMNIDEQVRSYIYMTMMAGCAGASHLGGSTSRIPKVDAGAIARYELFDWTSEARQLGIYLRGTTSYNGNFPDVQSKPGYHDCNHDGGEWVKKAIGPDGLWTAKYSEAHPGITNPFSEPTVFACKVMGAVREQGQTGADCPKDIGGAENSYVFNGSGQTRRDRTFNNIYDLIYKNRNGDNHNYELSNAQKYVLYLKSFLVGCQAEDKRIGTVEELGGPTAAVLQEDHVVVVDIVVPTSVDPDGYIPTAYRYPKGDHSIGIDTSSSDTDVHLAVRDYKQATGSGDYVEQGCAGIVNVLNNHVDPAVGGSEWRTGFSKYQTLDPDGAAATGMPGISDEPPSDLELHCDNGSFDFIVCPMIELGVSAIQRLDSFVMDMLNVDVKPIFGEINPETGADTIDEEGNTAHGYYMAWSSFRVIAIGILVIAGLVMVISQALGFELLDAYTIRKTLPRLLVAAIGISLSWQLMRLVVEFFDTVGIGVRQLMYGPFTSLGGAQIDFGSGILSTIIGGGGALLLLGPSALTFVLTALLAVAVGYLSLVVRQIFIVMLIILAPVAIACYILPNTQKVWKMWFDNFLGMLLAFPIISAMIAAGHIFAVVATHNDDPAVFTATLTSGFASVFHIGGQQAAAASHFAVALATTAVAVIAYFLPYAFIPKILAMTNKLMGMVVNGFEGLTKGWREGLAKYRANASRERFAKMRSGTLYNPDSRLTKLLGGRVVNRVGAHVGAGFRGRFGFGATGAAARANNVHATADTLARENAAFAAQMNNEDVMAALALGGDRSQLRRLRHFQGEEGQARLEAALAGARSVGGGQRTQVAALDALAKSGKVLQNRGELGMVLDSVAKGNGALRGALKGNYQFTSRQVGRADIGRDTDMESLQELDVYSLGRAKPITLENLFGARGAAAAAQAVDADGNPAPRDAPIMQAIAASRLAGNQAEANHYVDILYAAQYSPGISPQLQQQVQEAIATLNSSPGGPQLWQGARTRAQQRYTESDEAEQHRRANP